MKYLCMVLALAVTGCDYEQASVEAKPIQSTAGEGLKFQAPYTNCLQPLVPEGKRLNRQAWNNNVYQARRILLSVGIKLETYCRITVNLTPDHCIYMPGDAACYLGRGGASWITLNNDASALVHEIIHVHLFYTTTPVEDNVSHIEWDAMGYNQANTEFGTVVENPFL